MFEQLVLVDHPNIVKLHKYWLDASETRARVSHGHTTRGGTRPPVGGAALGTHAQLAEPASPPVPQVIFITEYVSSGSLKQFLKKTKKNHKAMNARVWGMGWRGVGDWTGAGRLRGQEGGWPWGGGAGRAPQAQPPLPCRSDGVRLPPGLEALVHADPVGAQVRAWACRLATPPRPHLPGAP